MSERATPGQHPGTDGQRIHEERATPGQQALPARGNCSSSNSSSLRSDALPGFEPPAKNGSRPKKTKDTTWRKPLIEAVEPLLRREIHTWSADERFAWARWHCLFFANCTADEGRNRSQASKVAKGLASMALSTEYGDVTGSEYFRLAKIVHKQRGKVPWFDPWMIKAAIEIGASA